MLLEKNFSKRKQTDVSPASGKPKPEGHSRVCCRNSRIINGDINVEDDTPPKHI